MKNIVNICISLSRKKNYLYSAQWKIKSKYKAVNCKKTLHLEKLNCLHTKNNRL